eukprot:6181951-Pleurochrysis_carterae.AAC.4
MQARAFEARVKLRYRWCEYDRRRGQNMTNSESARKHCTDEDVVAHKSQSEPCAFCYRGCTNTPYCRLKSASKKVVRARLHVMRRTNRPVGLARCGR